MALSPAAQPLLIHRSWLWRLLGLNWQTVLLAGFGVGAVLIAASWAVGVGVVSYPTGGDPAARQVGYLAALNWSAGYLILFPIATALLVAALEEVNQVFGRLEQRGMLHHGVWKRPDTPGYALRYRWLRGGPVRLALVVVLGAALPIILMWEVYANNYCRLYKGGRTPLGENLPEIKDMDWGLAANFMHWTPFHRLLNVSFDYCAFAAESFYITMAVIFIVYVVDAALVLTQEAGRLGVEIWPAWDPDDPRRGFKEFEPLLNRMLVVVMVGYLLSYLVRLESLYMTNASGDNPLQWTPDGQLPIVKDSPANSLWQFIHNEAWAIIGNFHQHGLVTGIRNLFKPAQWTQQSAMSSMFELFLYVAAVMVVLATVCLLALRAKCNASRHYETKKTPLYGHALDEEKASLKKMVWWPVGWLRMNLLLVYTGIAIVSIVYYKIGAVVFVATLGVLFVKLQMARRRGG
jgi:hypothetical protein